ncbi:hypothetical protein J8TS2_28060 [Lederbergia ruris]|uniref:Uncharacterized protein n=1 Tax=Lederbergia ruris TaxID=217495 RepID=A0ABQ4KM92_9BACI|nr:hypothetical protein [Lederbergia ruris]GIN58487.1 hypothetical protein J8TS2_28060 [Lederbergia ruris]
MTNDNNKGVYIPSIEAEQLYDMTVRGLENITKYEYLGMVPFSLELIKLRSFKRLFGEKMIVKNSKEKYYSDAVINVKFKNKIKKNKEIVSNVRGYDNLMERMTNQLKSLNKSIEDTQKALETSQNKRESVKMEKTINYLSNRASLVNGHIERIRADKDNGIYESMGAPELRQKLYVDGFTFKGRKYVFYKRTASKSRQSQCLFILEDLFEPMKEWSHMGLDLTGKIDVASLLAYESLVSSSLEGTITINPDNIFIIDDKFSEFEVNAIEVGNDLKAKPNDKATIRNNIWDGQGLMNVSIFESIGQRDKGMALLRQHFFKSCVFNANIQQFLEDNCPEGIEYDQWELIDMFGNTMKAKDILVITTPSSLKFLKYANEDKKGAFNNWKKCVKQDNNLFGICKHEKPSKYGDRSYTSYQMINTLDANKEDIKALAQYEVDYIQGLQDDDEAYIKHLNDKKELTNAYEMMVDLYKINPDVVRTKMFRDYRKRQISNYKTKAKGGKLRLKADYCTVVSNPYEMLETVLDSDREVVASVLKGNEIHTTLHPFGVEYTLVRNPHNAMHNFFKAENVECNLIDKYFNFSKNIVVINSIGSPILDICNGMDMDSDTVLIFADENFNKIVDRTLVHRNYPVILNQITSEASPVELTNENIAEIDEKTAKSQMWIGQITNLAQYQVSLLWDIQNSEDDTEKKEEKINELLDNLSILVVLSNVAIDYSKKVVNVDVDKALRDIKKSKAAKIEVVEEGEKGKIKFKLKSRKKPRFWKYVSSSAAEMESFECPMDILIEHINDIPKGLYRANMPFGNLLINVKDKGDHKQIKDIVELISYFDNEIKQLNSNNSDPKCTEKNDKLVSLYDDITEKISKKKIKPETMGEILREIANMYDNPNKISDLSAIAVHLLNTLYKTNKKEILKLFIKRENSPKSA